MSSSSSTSAALAFVLALVPGGALVAACAPRAPSLPAEPPPRDVHARWLIETLPAPPLALDWHDPLRVSLVVDGQVVEGTRAAECSLGGEWLGVPAPQSMVQCSIVGGRIQVGAFRDGDAVVVRRQSWELVDADQGPPAVHGEETGRVLLAPGGRLIFDPPRAAP